eukprot:SAG31_NODE_1199_length_9431_cov_18.273789_1_plen_163_part_00
MPRAGSATNAAATSIQEYLLPPQSQTPAQGDGSNGGSGSNPAGLVKLCPVAETVQSAFVQLADKEMGHTAVDDMADTARGWMGRGAEAGVGEVLQNLFGGAGLDRRAVQHTLSDPPASNMPNHCPWPWNWPHNTALTRTVHYIRARRHIKRRSCLWWEASAM